MDCLDRTNIVQSTIANFIVKKILLKERIECNENPRKNIEKTINEIWWENGNALSFFNAGTNSLKSDILM